MRFLHIIIPSKRMMDTYVRMIREHFEYEEHTFCFYEECHGQDRDLFQYGNFVELTGSPYNKVKELYRLYKKYEVVIWHGLMFGIRRMLPLYINPFLVRKSVWIMRGIDLYNWKIEEASNIREIIINHINYSVRRRMRLAVAIFPPDQEVYIRQFGQRKRVKVIAYPISKDAFSYMDTFDAAAERNNGYRFLMIGNSAYSYNNHIEAIDRVSHYADEKVKFYIPFSYGNAVNGASKDYPTQVKDYAKQQLGEKVEIITKLMDSEEYTKFLMNMDIAIINSKRQNALGNILRLLYVGNKIYIAPENPMYQYFIEQGIDVYDASRLPELSYADFCKPARREQNAEWIKRKYHPDKQYVEWQALFQEIAAACGKDKHYAARTHEGQSEEERNDRRNRKINYLFVEKWQPLKKGSRIADISHVYIAGMGEWKYSVVKWMEHENRMYKRWFIHGIITDEEKVKTDRLIKQDVICGFDEYTPESDECIVLAIDDITERRIKADFLIKKGVKFVSYVSALANANIGAIGIGTIISPGTNVDASSVIGEFCFVRNATVRANCNIGDYCNIVGDRSHIEEGVTLGDFCRVNDAYISHGTVIGNGCCIEEDVHIGKDVRLGNNVTICSHARVEDHTFVPDGTVVTDFRSVNPDREKGEIAG